MTSPLGGEGGEGSITGNSVDVELLDLASISHA
jgi:hypothetical protein